MSADELTAARLRELLHYNPDTGAFTWLLSTSNRVRAGDVAGSARQDGYRIIRVDGRFYLAHRLAWFYIGGEFPVAGIDHINGCKADNRLCNLREASMSQNKANICKHANNASGFKGVSWHRRSRKWAVQIMISGRRIYLGRFRCRARAAIVADVAAVLARSEYARVDPSIREALDAPRQPQPRVYIRPPHARARVHCHYIQLGKPSAMFMHVRSSRRREVKMLGQTTAAFLHV
jgi:HNH endonuclease/AP2 domain